MPVIRPLIKADYHSISQIYKEGIQTKMATFETVVPDWTSWDGKYISCCRLVAEADEKILAYAVLSKVSKREVYKGVAEVSLYVKEEYRGKGIGKQLLKALISCSEEYGFWTLQAAIFPENKPSIRIHEASGFREVGRRERIACLDGIWRDNIIMEKRSNKVGK